MTERKGKQDHRRSGRIRRSRADISAPINSYYVELWLTNEIEAAEEREKNSPNLMIDTAAGAQKAALRRVLEKVQKWKGKTGLYEV